jgi:GST-like protein
MYILYSMGTPNGIKPTILLEELGLPYTLKLIDISKGEQFDPEFLKISPNNKIPAMFDEDNQLYMFESVAMMQYLAEKHQEFLPTNLVDKYKVIPWCYFQAAHIGPMFGQFGHFNCHIDEKIPYAMKRYADECKRLMGVMDKQLASNRFISGSGYTIADMAIWPWVYCYEEFYKQDIDAEAFPHLVNWYNELATRAAIKAALKVYGKE